MQSEAAGQKTQQLRTEQENPLPPSPPPCSKEAPPHVLSSNTSMHPWGSEGAQKRVHRRLENVAKAAEGSYCRLEMPWKLVVAVRKRAAGL